VRFLFFFFKRGKQKKKDASGGVKPPSQSHLFMLVSLVKSNNTIPSDTPIVKPLKRKGKHHEFIV